MNIEFGWKRKACNAGLITICGDRGYVGWGVHFGVMRERVAVGLRRGHARAVLGGAGAVAPGVLVGMKRCEGCQLGSGIPRSRCPMCNAPTCRMCDHGEGWCSEECMAADEVREGLNDEREADLVRLLRLGWITTEEAHQAFQKMGRSAEGASLAIARLSKYVK